VPADTFGARLALVRQASGGLNVKAAADRCGLSDQAWRNWEAERVHPRDFPQVCRQIADTFGFDLNWLAFGGPLASSSTKWYLTAQAVAA
jgi:transcriptional regulator with XRE-family HTH domain